MKKDPSFLDLRFFTLMIGLTFLPIQGWSVHKMDAQIGRAPGVYLGDNVYGTFAGQTIALGLERKAAFFFRMQHDLEFTNATSLGSAVVRLRGSFGRRLDLKVFRIDGTRTNVTGAITGAGLNLANFDVDTEADFSVRATRRSDARRGFAKVKINGALTALAEVSGDAALAEIRVK